ncbi:hypothetical protein MicloDRAFT_00001710 [Microvirga lotononidis]|uniref:Uncharacterized protein n=1 Tax=Microvirga lotononidis TaxID=864069 RepID=I4Z4N9_9HYPH|nr:hypothetical protein MicloDRAFT_00001710 [Microvirga lotononidis]
MAPTLVKFEVYRPNGKGSSAIGISAANTTVFSKGGALCFQYLYPNGTKFFTHIFSPIGYKQCTASKDLTTWYVSPTFDPTKPDIVEIHASFVGFTDDDGTAVFWNYDRGNQWPVAFFPREAYCRVTYVGPVKAREPESELWPNPADLVQVRDLGT